MTDDERNEFEKSIGTARRVYREHQYGDPTPLGIVVGALIRAVELLAGQDQFRDVTKKVEPTSTGHFDDALVERLARLSFDVQIHDDDIKTLVGGSWEAYSPRLKASGLIGIRAILAELVAMPNELPSPDELGTLWANDPYWAMTLHARIAPILAAQKASLTHYRKSFEAKQARVAELEAVANQSAQQYAQALARITELESRSPANEVQNAERAQYEKTIELQNRRIAELERELGTKHEKRRMAVESHKSDKASWMERIAELEAGFDHDVLEATRDQRDVAVNRVEELEKRIAELTAPMVVDGKTPGEVGKEAFLMKRFGYLAGPEYVSTDQTSRDEWESVGLAVLRAFGNGAKTKEALQKVREQLLARAKIIPWGDGSQRMFVEAETLAATIDAEIAKCGSRAQSQSTLNKLRERFTHTPDPGDGDDGKWISRTNVLNAIDEIANIEGVKPIKMVANCTICGCINERAFLDPCVANGTHNFEAK